MPPKKSEKAKAAEIKKKNVKEASDIVAALKGTSVRDKSQNEKTSKAKSIATVHRPEVDRLFDPAKMDEIVVIGNVNANGGPPTKSEKSASNGSKKRIDAAKDVVLKKMTRKDAVSNANADAVKDLLPIVSRESGSKVGDMIVHQNSGAIEHAETSSKKPLESKMKPSHRGVASSKASYVNNSARSIPSMKKSKSGHGTGYQYELDCQQVADSIDVVDVKRYLETHLKVDGTKNNFGSTVTISCEGQKVVIKSKAFLPKKSLRFLSKKYLKKNWNIRVLSKNVHAYEYVYVGTR